MRIRTPMAIVGLLVAGSALSARADEWKKTFPLTGRADLRVETNDGRVRVDTYEGKEIEARVETMGWKIADNEVRVSANQTGNSVQLDVKLPRRWSMGWSGNRWVHIDLRIPRESNLWVRTGDGSVEVQPIVGSLDVQTGDGHITVASAKGEVRLATGDGHIEARELDGRLDASSGDGHITVAGRFDRLNLRTGDGRIDARALPGSKMDASWSVRTGDGSVTLRLPDGFAADLDAETRDGRISVDFPVAVSGMLSQRTIRGKINGGGQVLSVHTGDGSIRLERL